MVEYDDALIQESEKLEKMLTNNPDMAKRVQKIIGKVMKRIASDISDKIPRAAQMKSDPHQAHKAVKYAVYKRILGANISILDKRKRSKASRSRSEGKTQTIAYWGEERAFILRFLNSGTNNRYTGRKEGWRYASWRSLRRAKEAGVKIGRRGAIEARNFFPGLAYKGLKEAAEQIQQIITEEIATELK